MKPLHFEPLMSASVLRLQHPGNGPRRPTRRSSALTFLAQATGSRFVNSNSQRTRHGLPSGKSGRPLTAPTSQDVKRAYRLAKKFNPSYSYPTLEYLADIQTEIRKREGVEKEVRRGLRNALLAALDLICLGIGGVRAGDL